jgi:hypothetical protein
MGYMLRWRREGMREKTSGLEAYNQLMHKKQKMLWDRQASYMPANYYMCELLDQL